MFLFRWLSGLPVAAAITLGLFFLMSQLIRDRGEILPNPKPSIDIKITASEVDPAGPVRPKPPTRIKEDLPPTEIEFEKQRGPGRIQLENPGPVTVDRKPDGGGAAIAPIFRIAPQYPENCRSRNAEGVVIVQFDVTPEGNVVNASIVESADTCFNRTVLKLVEGWKYPPTNSGQMRYGAVERFNFQLTD